MRKVPKTPVRYEPARPHRVRAKAKPPISIRGPQPGTVARLPGQTVTVCIPTIPPRGTLLQRALASVWAQTSPVEAISISYDLEKLGAWANRNRAMENVATDFIAFLDDDDEFMPHHIQRCFEVQAETGADVVVPWYEVVGGSDPVPFHRGKQPNKDEMHSFGITCIVRREAMGDLRFRSREECGIGEDYDFWIRLAQSGAKMVGIEDITWKWNHWFDGNGNGNTSGRAERW
jgi:glycosyltransferase involved in cell wall biosynthesis